MHTYIHTYMYVCMYGSILHTLAHACSHQTCLLSTRSLSCLHVWLPGKFHHLQDWNLCFAFGNLQPSRISNFPIPILTLKCQSELAPQKSYVPWGCGPWRVAANSGLTWHHFSQFDMMMMMMMMIMVLLRYMVAFMKRNSVGRMIS